MKYGIKKRFLSLLLCACMIAPLFTFGLPIYADGESAYEENIGCLAVFNTTTGKENYIVSDLEPDEDYAEYSMVYYADEIPADLELEIIDCKQITELFEGFDENGGTKLINRLSLWYQVKLNSGTMPEGFEDEYWVMQNYLNEEDVYEYDSLLIYSKDSVSITDINGNKIDTLVMGQYEKPEIVAKSELEGNVSYQWQIEYSENCWVDIFGETSEKVKLSYGMVASLLSSSGVVHVRCMSTNGIEINYSKSIPVYLEMYHPEESETVISEELVTSNGQTVTVTVSGSMPENAFVETEETDAEGVEVRPAETVVAALDITVMDSNGLVWQPGAGESVTVTLEADKLGLENGNDVVVYHLHNGEVVVVGCYKVENGILTFDVDGFSKFVFALAEKTVTTEDVKSDVSKKATVNELYTDLWMVKDPTALTEYAGNWYVRAVEGVDYVSGVEFTVTDAYVSDVYPYGIFYKIEAVKGTDLFTSVITDNPWVFQGYQDDPADYVTLILSESAVDPEEPEEPSVDIVIDGEKVTEIAVSANDKVTLTASPNVENANVTYKWEIYISQADMWVAISGQTASTCTVNYGMVANRLDSNGQAHIRCTATVDGEQIITDPVAVTVVSAYDNSRSAFSTRAASAYGVMPIEDGDEVEGTKYTLTVRFVSGDSDKAIFQPYRAEFINGEIRTINIPVTNKAGYYAVYDVGAGPVEVVDDTIVMADKYLTADEELVVRYYPKMTLYKVVHYIQNIYDDEYSILEEVTDLTGLTDTTVPNNLNYTEEELPGFYTIPYARPAIAADGSTVIEIYYDRYYYLVNFNLGEGGYGVEPEYARYGTEINFGDPTRKGYEFIGWTLNGISVTSPFSTPAGDCIIVAGWKAVNAEYTVIYWKENANPNADGTYGYSFWTSRPGSANSGTEVSGRDDVAQYVSDEDYFTYNDVRTDKNVVVKGDGSSVVNVYYTRNYYDIYFYVSDSGNNNVKSCQSPTHSHSDGTCTKYFICGVIDGHNHDNTCEKLLTCGTTAHSHSNVCCTIPVHEKHTAECCTLSTSHTHIPNCYESDSVSINDTPSTPRNAPTTGLKEGYVYKTGNNRYIYINGKWYQMYGSYATDKTIMQTTDNCPGTHTHGDGNCSCELAIHTHDNVSCSCAQSAHTHGDNCYKYSCGKVAHNHTDACYSDCTKAAHTHNDGNCINSSKYLLKIIHAKYDSDIYDQWPVADQNIDGLIGFSYWSGNSAAGIQSSRVVTMNSDWAKSGGVKVSANYNSTAYQLNYWFEDVDQSDKTVSSTRVLYNNKYYVLSEKYTQIAYYSNTNSWSYKTITGMKASSSSATIQTVNGQKTANLYYNRLSYTLMFVSDNKEVEKETGVVFEKELDYYLDENGEYTVIPEYPVGTLEEGGYYFDGWYSTKECFEGTKFDFATEIMPGGDLTLYAKWAPKEHTIEFYFDSSMTEKLKDEDGFTKQVVLHNSYGADPGLPGHPLDFEAVLWFYMDENGVEQSFDFSMPVKRDMKLYPKWRSNVFMDYEVHYLIEGTNISIAEPTVGEELYGKSVTFNPKGQNEFYDQYRDGGYFVYTPTHTIVMGESSCTTNTPNCYWDENAKKHVFTFYYSEGPTVPYIVRYLDQNGNKMFDDKVVSDNRKAIVVENALIKSGYRPDEAQKSLVVVKDGGTNNVITFYYEKDEEASYYTVTHYIKKYGSNEYVVYHETPYNATVGDIVPDQKSLKLDGFTYVETENTVLGGTVESIGSNGEPGLAIKMYYDEKPVTIYYEVIDNFGGTVSPNSNVLGTVYGTASGSTATPESKDYRFVGWYADFEGKDLVSNDPKFVPTKKSNEKWIDGITYYAKFEYNLTSLTIKKQGYDAVDANQTFIFKLTDEDGLSITVTVHGSGSVTVDGLKVGKTYRVVEVTEWSWRYKHNGVVSAATTVTLTGADVTNGAEFTLNPTGNVLTFTNERNNSYWLDGDSWCNNIFK